MTPITHITDYIRSRKPSLDSLLGGYSGRRLTDANNPHRKLAQCETGKILPITRIKGSKKLTEHKEK